MLYDEIKKEIIDLQKNHPDLYNSIKIDLETILNKSALSIADRFRLFKVLEVFCELTFYFYNETMTGMLDDLLLGNCTKEEIITRLENELVTTNKDLFLQEKIISEDKFESTENYRFVLFKFCKHLLIILNRIEKEENYTPQNGD